MALSTSAGTTVAICTTASVATTQSALAALTYVPIGSVESLGEIGPQGADVTFKPLSGADVQHLKGSTDNGALQIVCGRDPLDTGQIAMKVAAATKLQYAFKVTLDDGADANDTDSIYYLRGPLMGGRASIGGADDVTKATWNVGLNVFKEVASVAVP